MVRLSEDLSVVEKQENGDNAQGLIDGLIRGCK